MIEVRRHKPATGKEGRHLKTGNPEAVSESGIGLGLVQLRRENTGSIQKAGDEQHRSECDGEEELAFTFTESPELSLKEEAEVKNKVDGCDEHEAGHHPIHIGTVEMGDALVVGRETTGREGAQCHRGGIKPIHLWQQEKHFRHREEGVDPPQVKRCLCHSGGQFFLGGTGNLGAKHVHTA